MLTKLRFLEDSPRFETEIPYELYGHPKFDSGRITNCTYTEVDNILIEDVRQNPKNFTLENAGFTYITHESICSLASEHFETAGSNLEKSPIVTAYLEETMSLVKEQTSADRVICFDWRFRRSGGPNDIKSDPFEVEDIRFQAVRPGFLVHCDFSHDGGLERLEMHLLPEELELVRSGKVKARIINVWRPLGTVKNAPLVLTDRRSVHKEDLIEVEKVLPDKVERAYFVKYQAYHRWYYLSEQSPKDVAMFVTWDCDEEEVKAAYPPHGAASQFTEDPYECPRESVEARLIVFTSRM
ncbi:uncharacterized protein LY89DRAFT_645599 [Mollisia scopiformis]|uniref:Methyltransferase n=1 Tax=Mollisia scopiformis TaxID=149040 RepID=A0A194X972_MOLSC|nr:uncharacterized protein LY89DRAFT_645599 [Mollisia scopiformis]KUJ16721.1 hypothetical protein LY89DRAFT_645599 [Mollisia scopiformis]